MKLDHVEYPQLTQIKGTNMYYNVFSSGSSNMENGFENYARYLEEKLGWKEKAARRVVLDRCIKIFTLPEGSTQTIEESIKDGTAQMVGYLQFEPADQNFNLDMNDNLLLKSHGYGWLRDSREGGNVLISRDGRVLKNLEAHGFIYPADAFGNYPVDIFMSKKQPMGGPVNVVGMKYNFITPDGKFVSKSHFERSEEPILYTLKPKTKFSSPSFVYDAGKSSSSKPDYYPTIVDLVLANREAQRRFIEDDSYYLRQLYDRQKKMPYLFLKLNELYQMGEEKGGISLEDYQKIQAQLAEEVEKMDYFMQRYENDKDREVYNNMDDCSEM